MTLLSGPVVLWLFVVVVAAVMVLGCLRVIGFEYYHAVRWHNLRVEVQRLRAEQVKRLAQMARQEATAAGLIPPEDALAADGAEVPVAAEIDVPVGVEVDAPAAAAA